jgi:hypothetical protein
LPRIAGLGYVLGVSIENMEALGAPTLTSSVDEIRAQYADRAFGIVTSFAGAFALLAYVALAAALDVWLREGNRQADPWRTIGLLGGLGGPVVAAVGLSTVAIRVAGSGAGLGDELVGGLYDFYLLCRIVSAIFVALLLAGFGFAALRSGLLPRPLCWYALALAMPMTLAPLAVFDQEPGLELTVAIAFAAQTLWIFLTSMWLTLADGGRSPSFAASPSFCWSSPQD